MNIIISKSSEAYFKSFKALSESFKALLNHINILNIFKIVNNNSEVSSAAENSYFHENLNVFRFSELSEDSSRIRTFLKELLKNDMNSDIKFVNENNALNSSY